MDANRSTSDAQRKPIGCFLPLMVVLILVLASLVAVGVYVRRSLNAFEQSLKPITDPAFYQAALAEQNRCMLLTHLPPTIPATASNVRFYYQRPFLQGPLEMLVRYRLPPADLQAIVQQARPRATTMPVQQSCPCMTPIQLPSTFQAFVFDFTSKDGKGHSRGIAVDTSASEVAYWAEVW